MRTEIMGFAILYMNWTNMSGIWEKQTSFRIYEQVSGKFDPSE